IRNIATSTSGCIRLSPEGVPKLDAGVILVKNMLQISQFYMARTTNVHYELVYHFLPTQRAKRIYSQLVGTIRVFEVRHNAITRKSSYQYLHDLDVGNMDGVTGFLG
ncbi:hypothetical protein ACHHYP_20276, partial [Achlya hypogyna]